MSLSDKKSYCSPSLHSLDSLGPDTEAANKVQVAQEFTSLLGGLWAHAGPHGTPHRTIRSHPNTHFVS